MRVLVKWKISEEYERLQLGQAATIHSLLYLRFTLSDDLLHYPIRSLIGILAWLPFGRFRLGWLLFRHAPSLPRGSDRHKAQ